LIVPLGPGAGPTCEIPVGQLTEEVAAWAQTALTKVFEVSAESGNPLAQAVQTVRQVASKLPGIGDITDKNLSVGDLSVGGESQGWTWGVSGTSGQQVQAIEGEIGQVAQAGDSVATTKDGLTWKMASDHAETKVLGGILRKIKDLKLLPGTEIDVTVYTEKFPCIGCGGADYYSGNLLAFRKDVEALGYKLNLNVLFSSAFNGRPQ
jgi:hypothetical protein